MDLRNIREIKEVYSAEKANELLAQGWSLLAVTTEASPNAAEFDSVIRYSIGKPFSFNDLLTKSDNKE